MASSLQKVENAGKPTKPKRLPQEKFSEVSERLIEREFFPTIYKKRLEEEVIDLTETVDPVSSKKSKSRSHQDLDPLRLASVGLDDFNTEYIAKSTVNLQQSLADTKRNRNERLYGITDEKQLNPFMFNHPGISFTSNRRPKINFDNTRFPEGFVFEEPKRRSTRVGIAPPLDHSAGDILQRTKKRKDNSPNL